MMATGCLLGRRGADSGFLAESCKYCLFSIREHQEKSIYSINFVFVPRRCSLFHQDHGIKISYALA
jgi:hypothetical protein